MQTKVVMMDSIAPLQIPLKPRVLVENPNADISDQYLFKMSRPDTFNLIHQVFIRDGSEEMQRLRALTDCATSFIVAYRLGK
jgi:hypothetical protein